MSDNDETDDDFDSLTENVSVNSHSVSVLEVKNASVTERASVNDSGQHKPPCCTANSLQCVLPLTLSPPANNSHSSASLASVSSSTGTVCFVTNSKAQLIY